MLIAHAPAGYLLGRIMSWVVKKDPAAFPDMEKTSRSIVTAAIIGGIAPDLDFIYHIFIDSARTPHHSYFTHMPFFWAGLWIVLYVIGKVRRDSSFRTIAAAFCLGAILHLLLDTFTGVIYWFYPFWGKGVNFFAVADVHVWWVENFTRHWTFTFEIAIIAAAMAVYLGPKKTLDDLALLFRHEKLRSLFLRCTVCAIGLAVVVLVGSMQFNVQSHALELVIKLKHHVERML
jgi:inner membrane protein